MADINIFTSGEEPQELTRCTVTSGAASLSRICRNSKVLSCLQDLASSIPTGSSGADLKLDDLIAGPKSGQGSGS
jgi:hypothetical protein